MGNYPRLQMLLPRLSSQNLFTWERKSGERGEGGRGGAPDARRGRSSDLRCGNHIQTCGLRARFRHDHIRRIICHHSRAGNPFTVTAVTPPSLQLRLRLPSLYAHAACAPGVPLTFIEAAHSVSGTGYAGMPEEGRK